LQHGLAIYPSPGTIDGTRGDHLIVAPPYIVRPEHIETIVERLESAINAALAGLL
jgi:adenosylmethionine-8-amino-7-oxononanoate aminotransferase